MERGELAARMTQQNIPAGNRDWDRVFGNVALGLFFLKLLFIAALMAFPAVVLAWLMLVALSVIWLLQTVIGIVALVFSKKNSSGVQGFFVPVFWGCLVASSLDFLLGWLNTPGPLQGHTMMNTALGGGLGWVWLSGIVLTRLLIAKQTGWMQVRTSSPLFFGLLMLVLASYPAYAFATSDGLFLYATQNHEAALADLLLKCGRDPDLRIKELDPTPLQSAAATGDDAIVTVLVAHKANIHVYPEPLEIAVKDGHPSTVALLLAYGANPEGDGDWPLAEAVRSGNLTVVQTLIKGKADPKRKGPDDATLIDIARETRHPDVADFLKELGAVSVTSAENCPHPFSFSIGKRWLIGDGSEVWTVTGNNTLTSNKSRDTSRLGFTIGLDIELVEQNGLQVRLNRPGPWGYFQKYQGILSCDGKHVEGKYWTSGEANAKTDWSGPFGYDVGSWTATLELDDKGSP
jgi:hypothetical protein